jgi:hypothetical protein
MIKDMIELILSFMEKYEKGKAQLFNNHIEPLKNQIYEIHSDYLNSFIEVKKSLEKKEIPISEMLHFLEQRRHDLAGQRDLSQTIAIELKKANKSIVPTHAWEAFENFNNSILNYFVSANAVARASWYSDFIHFMKVYQMMGDIDFFETNVFGNDPRTDTIEHVTLIIEKRLPAALNEINKNYAALRSALL